MSKFLSDALLITYVSTEAGFKNGTSLLKGTQVFIEQFSHLNIIPKSSRLYFLYSMLSSASLESSIGDLGDRNRYIASIAAWDAHSCHSPHMVILHNLKKTSAMEYNVHYENGEPDFVTNKSQLKSLFPIDRTWMLT